MILPTFLVALFVTTLGIRGIEARDLEHCFELVKAMPHSIGCYRLPISERHRVLGNVRG